MSTAARMTPVISTPPTIPVLVARIAGLLEERRQLERDLTSQRIRTRAMERALIESHDAPKVVGMESVGGVLTVVLSNGAERQYRAVAICTETETIYRHDWVDIAPVPSTPAGIIAAALTLPEHSGMAVVA
jgi:hypothetical protein